MLSIGAAMLGARHVVGIDVDADALDTAQANVAEYEEDLPVGWVLARGGCMRGAGALMREALWEGLGSSKHEPCLVP